MKYKVFLIIFSFVMLLNSLCPICAAQTVNSYEVFDQKSLFSLEDDPYGEYYITKDIMLTGEHTAMFTSKDNPFYGVIDGGGHTITYLNIVGDDNVLAFIGYLKGTIKNVNFSFASVQSSNSNTVLGGMVAFNYGEIIDCHFSGRLDRAGEVPELCGINAFNIGQKIRCTEEITNSDSSLESSSSGLVYKDVETFDSDTQSEFVDHSEASSTASKESSSYSSKKSDSSSKTNLNSSKKSNSSSKTNSNSNSSATDSFGGGSKYNTHQYYSDTSSEESGESEKLGSAGILMVGIFGLALLSMMLYIFYKEVEEIIKYKKSKKEEKEQKD